MLYSQGRKHSRKTQASQPELIAVINSEPLENKLCVKGCLETYVSTDAPEDSASPVKHEAWEKYWAQQGEGLLWQTWLDNHPDSDASPALGPWDCPNTREEWELHASQTYHYYWEQFCYWSSQGWTMEEEETHSTLPPVSETPLDEQQPGAEAVMEGLDPSAQGPEGTCSDALEQRYLGMGDVTNLVGGLSLQVEQTGESVEQDETPSGYGCAKDRGDDSSQSVSSSDRSASVGEYRCHGDICHMRHTHRLCLGVFFFFWH